MALQQLLGQKEVAELLHVKPNTVGNWYRHRRVLNEHNELVIGTGYPDAAALVSGHPVWTEQQVREWYRTYVPRHPAVPKVGYLDEESG